MTTSLDNTVLLIGPEPGLIHSLEDAGFHVVTIQETDDIYKAFAEHHPQAVLLGVDSPSRDTLEHLATLGRKYPQPALLLQGGNNPEASRQALELGISAYVTAGMTSAAMKSMIEVSINHARQIHSLRRELARNQKTLSERKRIDSAKRVLWKQHGMNEEAAYKALKTMAMNSRCSIAEAAQRLLDSKEAQA